MQKDLKSKTLAQVGEAISHELGAKMVKDFQDVLPNYTIGYYIGRNILEEILKQPACVGIRFYNAINESGTNTLVYVGIDDSGNILTKYTYVNSTGKLKKEQGIVADRADSPSKDDPWNWFD
jgi:hypothetical protein